MNYEDRLYENAQANFQNFQKIQLEKSKQDIFDNAFQIHFYTELTKFLSDVDLGEELTEFYALEGEEVIDRLYQDFCNVESASIANWSDINDFIYNHYSFFIRHKKEAELE